MLCPKFTLEVLVSCELSFIPWCLWYIQELISLMIRMIHFLAKTLFFVSIDAEIKIQNSLILKELILMIIDTNLCCNEKMELVRLAVWYGNLASAWNTFVNLRSRRGWQWQMITYFLCYWYQFKGNPYL